MQNYKILTALALLLLSASTSWADESMQYNQKTLPNGDIETNYSSSDGTKVTSVQHKDGSIETTAVASDGTKNVTIQHKDGSVDSHTVPAPGTN